jgi:cysteinyl-tRNA synthetase
LSEPPIDIHAGGVDLIFPHHENEIAQSEGATGTQFSRFWVHVEHLMIEEASGRTDKMSKSLGNVFNLQDIVEQGFRPSALRFLYLGVHYRKQLRFSWTAMTQAEESMRRLIDFLARVEPIAALSPPVRDEIAARLQRAKDEFAEFMRADLNTSGAIAVIFDLVREINAAIDDSQLGGGDARAVLDTFGHFDQVLGVLALRRAEDAQPPVPIEEIDQLIEARRAARLARNFAEADRIRKDLDGRGIVLEDTGSTTRWKRK